MNKLIILIGIPGCGKSTYAKKLIEMYPNWKYVSRDEVRYEYISDQDHYYDHEAEVFREFCNRIDMHLLNEEVVIADATHLTVGSRKKLLDNLNVIPDEIIMIYIDTPFEVCLKRNQAREGIIRVPDKTMYAMRNRLRPPNPVSENVDRIVRVKGE